MAERRREEAEGSKGRKKGRQGSGRRVLIGKGKIAMSWLQTGEITRGDACSWLRLEKGGKERRLVRSATPSKRGVRVDGSTDKGTEAGGCRCR